jgi:hypothetical protein
MGEQYMVQGNCVEDHGGRAVFANEEEEFDGCLATDFGEVVV